MPNNRSILLLIASFLTLILADIFQTICFWRMKELSPPSFSYFIDKIVLSDIALFLILSFFVLVVCVATVGIACFILKHLIKSKEKEFDLNDFSASLFKAICLLAFNFCSFPFIQTFEIEGWHVILFLLIFLMLTRYGVRPGAERFRIGFSELLVITVLYYPISKVISYPVKEIALVKEFNERQEAKRVRLVNKQEEVKALMSQYGIEERWDQGDNFSKRMSARGKTLFVGKAHCTEKVENFKACFDYTAVKTEVVENVKLECVGFEDGIEKESFHALVDNELIALVVDLEDAQVLREEKVDSNYGSDVPIGLRAKCGKFVKIESPYLEGEAYHPWNTTRTPWAGSGVSYKPEEASLADLLLFRNFLELS